MQGEHGFNAVRLSFSHEAVLQNAAIDLPADSHMSEWSGLPFLGMLVEFVSELAARGMLVIMACGRVSATSSPESAEEGLWYNSAVSDAQILKSWESIASVLCTEWNVIGVDVQNEVFATVIHSVLHTHPAHFGMRTLVPTYITPFPPVHSRMLVRGVWAEIQTGTLPPNVSETIFMATAHGG